MAPDPKIVTESPTPEFVLSVFQNMHRRSCEYGEADPDLVITRETTIANWRWGAGMLSTLELAESFNQLWQTELPVDQWLDCLEPECWRTVGDLCDFIAEYGQVPQLRSLAVFGSECRAAGVFLTIRDLLAKAGADVDFITPATPLAKYVREYPDTFTGPIYLLAPQAMPEIGFALDFNLAATFAGSLLIAAAIILRSWWLALKGLSLIIWSGFVPTRGTLEMRNVRTFKELSRVLATC